MKTAILFLLFTLVAIPTFSQDSTSVAINSDWEKVIITNNIDDVKGMERIGEVNESTMIPYARQSKLREKTREKVKKSAYTLGGSMVLIQTDQFSMAPLNNVNIIGTVYRIKEESVQNQ